MTDVTKKTACMGKVSAVVRLFRRGEDGSIIIFSLMMFVLILWFGGMAVDLMRYESTRAKLQSTLDRATLAAADLEQTLPPEDVCRDYFEKARMTDYLEGCTVEEGLNFRIVTASASVKMPLYFWDLAKVFNNPFTPSDSTLKVSGTSTAEERVTDVEISLVLDISGSMLSNQRIQNLRPAARDFVSTVLGNNSESDQGLITVSIVPYSGVVNVGPQIEPFLNINRTHNYSTCPIMIDPALYNTTALDMDASYDHISHFDLYAYGFTYAYHNRPIPYPLCYTGETNAIQVASDNEARLHAAIDNLVPYGSTAIDLGLKWGVALLDDSTNSIVASLAGETGTGVPAAAAVRPYAMGTPEVLKVVVLMTDGDNTNQLDLIEPYKSGMSFIWFNKEYDDQPLHEVPDTRFSVQYAGNNTPNYYWDDRFYWNRYSSSTRLRAYPNGFSSQWEYVNARIAGEGAVLAPGEGQTYGTRVHNARWQEVFASMIVPQISSTWLQRAYNHGAIPWSGNNFVNYNSTNGQNAVNWWVTTGGAANARLSTLCETARDNGIVIYTVAFEAPWQGQVSLQDCASSPSHYFDVSGTDITKAFAAIASDIRALKLTQ